MSDNTPRTQKEFVDYRLNQTDRKIDTVSDSINKQLDVINSKLDNNFATKDYVDAKVKVLADQIDDLLSDRTWLIRLVLGIVVASIITLIVRTK